MGPDDAVVVATNLTIAAGGAYAVALWLPWTVRFWSRLRRETLGLLPVSVCWLLAWVSIESAYFAVARIYEWQTGGSMRHGVWAIAVTIARLSILCGLVLHVIPRWRAVSMSRLQIRQRARWFAAALAVVWLVALGATLSL